MKLVRKKHISEPVTCSYCKVNKTSLRIQGGGHGGRTCCHSCFPEIKANYEEELRRENEFPGGELANERIDYFTRS